MTAARLRDATALDLGSNHRVLHTFEQATSTMRSPDRRTPQ